VNGSEAARTEPSKPTEPAIVAMNQETRVMRMMVSNRFCHGVGRVWHARDGAGKNLVSIEQYADGGTIFGVGIRF
jgi:hypothetical protein